jgi:hypothetical protein
MYVARSSLRFPKLQVRRYSVGLPAVLFAVLSSNAPPLRIDFPLIPPRLEIVTYRSGLSCVWRHRQKEVWSEKLGLKGRPPSLGSAQQKTDAEMNTATLQSVVTTVGLASMF